MSKEKVFIREGVTSRDVVYHIEEHSADPLCVGSRMSVIAADIEFQDPSLGSYRARIIYNRGYMRMAASQFLGSTHAVRPTMVDIEKHRFPSPDADQSLADTALDEILDRHYSAHVRRRVA